MLDQLEAEFPEHTPRPAGAPMALEGIRVIDFSHFIAGPFATMILADMGAEVVRIDRHGAGRDGVWEKDILSRGRTTVCVDLKSPRGAEAVLDLVAGRMP